jgi:membrane protein DedA with SNARE-associated domain
MIIPIVLGTSTISGVRYFFLDLIGAIIWANFFAFLGYFFGSALERFLGNIKKFEGIIALTVVLIVVCVQVIALQKRRALKNQGIAEAQKKA